MFPLVDASALSEEDLLAKIQLLRDRMSQASRSNSFTATYQLANIYTEYMQEYQLRMARKNQSTDWDKQIDIS